METNKIVLIGSNIVRMKTEKNVLIQYLLGVIFIASGIAKLLSIDDFQVFIYSLNIVNLNLSLTLTRIIIAVELSIGLLYLVRIYHKTVSYVTLVLMVFFTLFAFYLEKSNISEDCHCFGTIIQFSNTTTILKNIVIIMLVVYSIIFGKQKVLKYNKFIVVCSIIIGFGASIAVRPPDSIFSNKTHSDEYYNKPELDKFVASNKFNDRKLVICFFSYKCKYCQLAAKKISIISEKTNYPQNILYVFWKADNDTIDFFKETKTHTFSSINMNVIEFLKLTNGTMPLIVMYNNGVVENAYRYKDINESQIIRFLQE